MAAADHRERRLGGPQHLDLGGRRRGQRHGAGVSSRPPRASSPLTSREARRPKGGRACLAPRGDLRSRKKGLAVARDDGAGITGFSGCGKVWTSKVPGSRAGAPRAPGHLGEELEGALCGARVGLRRARDRRRPRRPASRPGKVVALGDELGADDDIDLALLDLAQGLAQIADARRACRSTAARVRASGKRSATSSAMRSTPGPHGDERMLGARNSGRSRAMRHEGPAMVAFEPAAESVLDQPGRAVRAFESEAAFPAERHRRIAAAIEEEERLLAARQASRPPRRPATGESQRPRSGGSLPHVDGRDRREACRLVARAEPDVAVAALLGVDQALDRGRRRAQHHRDSRRDAPRTTAVSRTS